MYSYSIFLPSLGFDSIKLGKIKKLKKQTLAFPKETKEKHSYPFLPPSFAGTKKNYFFSLKIGKVKKPPEKFAVSPTKDYQRVYFLEVATSKRNKGEKKYAQKKRIFLLIVRHFCLSYSF